ncbi:hypothetical protein MTP03_37980 [Tsukamurella sp. PLM1]|nr:hypothetical protein MTP03_37980 [Tsukamurella sp. PLM1]
MAQCWFTVALRVALVLLMVTASTAPDAPGGVCAAPIVAVIGHAASNVAWTAAEEVDAYSPALSALAMTGAAALLAGVATTAKRRAPRRTLRRPLP